MTFPTTKISADIVFLVDSTSCMRPCIDGVSRFVGEVMRRLLEMSKGSLDARAKVCGFRDAMSDADWFEDSEFVSRTEDVVAQARRLDAHGGAKRYSSALDALLLLFDQEESEPGCSEPGRWRNLKETRRITILIANSPYRPRACILKHHGFDYTALERKIYGCLLIFTGWYAGDTEFIQCYQHLDEISHTEWIPLRDWTAPDDSTFIDYAISQVQSLAQAIHRSIGVAIDPELRDKHHKERNKKMPEQGTQKVKGVADIVFLVDVTGSMQSCIDGLKVAMKDFFGQLTADDNPARIHDWRAKVVGFRDINFDDDWLENPDFVTTVEDVESQIDKLHAHGGGPLPESLLDALLTVAHMPDAPRGETADGYTWRNRSEAARAIVVFTDAPYHERASHPSYEGSTYEDVNGIFGSKRIILCDVTPGEPFGIQNCATQAEKDELQSDFEKCHKNLDAIDKAEWIPLRSVQGEKISFADIPSNMGKFRTFMAQLGKTVSASVDAVLL